MSENSTVNSHPSITPTGSPPLPPKDEVEPSMVTPDKRAPTPRPSGGSEETKVRRDTERPKDERRDAERSTRDERETERSRDERKRPERPREERRDAERSEEMIRRLRKEVGDLKVLVNRERASVVRLRGEGEKLIGKCRHREDIIARLEQDIKEIHHSYQGALHEEVRRTQAVEERLKKSEELLATRSAELSVAHTFLSTTDRLSESEVLSIVRDLNENIYQVAVNLTEEWEKLEPPEATNRMDVDPASQPPVPILVQLTRNRDLTGLTLWLQLCLCRRAVEMTSSWGQHEKFAVLDDVYERLSTSEGQAISARWRSLTHTYLSRPLPDPTAWVEQLAGVLDETGSFSSTQPSLEFVRNVGLKGIETIIQLAIRLEHAFMVEVTSSDMSLLFEAPDTVFDDTRMANELGSDNAPVPGGLKDKIAGTMEVGVEKRISGGGPGKIGRAKILLKTKVVLEKDLV